MYFFKKTYVKNWDHMAPEEKTYITVKRDGKVHKHIDKKRIAYIVEEVGYWRKFNALHKWFVDNVQNGVDECQEALVRRGQIMTILAILNQVWSNKDNLEKVQALLPVGSGPFFGPDDYEEWYFNNVERSIKIFQDLLAEDTEGDSVHYYYQSSW